MNLYFLLEGRRTEYFVYPKWLTLLLPKLTKVNSPNLVVENNYFLISGQGFPSILHNHLKKSIEDINQIGNFNYLVIILDADDCSVQERKNEVEKFITKNNLLLNNCEIEIVIQNRCIETWFLGNRKIYVRYPQDNDLQEFIKYYDVFHFDPEVMGNYNQIFTHANFHAEYLKKMLNERNIRYTKANPRGVVEKYYLDELLRRIEEEKTHLLSFKSFIQFCKIINDKII